MKVEWTGTAVRDVRAIKAYISRDSTAYAKRFAPRVVAAAESLDVFPLRGRPVPEANDDSIRELLFGNYRIIYRIESSRVLGFTNRDMRLKLARTSYPLASNEDRQPSQLTACSAVSMRTDSSPNPAFAPLAGLPGRSKDHVHRDKLREVAYPALFAATA